MLEIRILFNTIFIRAFYQPCSLAYSTVPKLASQFVHSLTACGRLQKRKLCSKIIIKTKLH